jgi:predicted O-methyltransferase YrrM
MSNQATSWRIRQLNSLVKWVTRALPERVAQQFLIHLLESTPNNATIIQKLEFSIRNQEPLHERSLRELILAICDEERTRGQVVDVLLHYMKSRAPDIDRMPFDLPAEGQLDFENLSGLFAATCLDESIITMNVRQTAYLFGLIRRSNAAKVIEIGRHWGGSTLVIAAAMRGRGEFWSIGDPAQLEHDLKRKGRTLGRPVEDQIGDLCRRLGLNVHVFAGKSQDIDIETGEVDVVFIDGDHSYEAETSDFQRFGTRVKVGGAVLLDDAVHDPFYEPRHTADVKRVVQDILRRADFRLVKRVKRLAHFERIH